MSSPKATCKPAGWVQKTRRKFDCCAVQMQSVNFGEESTRSSSDDSTDSELMMRLKRVPRGNPLKGLQLRDLNGHVLPSPAHGSSELTRSSSTHSSDESTDDEVMKRMLRRVPRGNPRGGLKLRDLHGNILSSPDQSSTLTTSSYSAYSSSDESTAGDYTDLGYTIGSDDSSEQTLTSVSVINLEPDESPMTSDLLSSTLSYPLSSTMMISCMEEQRDETVALSLMIDEEQILMREGRKLWDDKRTLRRQSGMVRLPGLK